MKCPRRSVQSNCRATKHVSTSTVRDVAFFSAFNIIFSFFRSVESFPLRDSAWRHRPLSQGVPVQKPSVCCQPQAFFYQQNMEHSTKRRTPGPSDNSWTQACDFLRSAVFCRWFWLRSNYCGNIFRCCFQSEQKLAKRAGSTRGDGFHGI